MKTRFLIASLALLAALPAFGWGYHECAGGKMTWPGSYMTFRASTISFPDTYTQNALNQAVNSWNFAPGMNFGMLHTFQNFSTATQWNGSNEIGFTLTGFSGDDIAVTHYLPACTTMLETDILFNANYNWTFNPAPSGVLRYEPFSFGGVAVHELGHALGLKHQTNTLAMMAPNYPNGGNVGQGSSQHFQPLADDVAGGRAGYGTDMNDPQHDLVASAYASYNDEDTGPTIPTAYAYRGRGVSFGFGVGNRGWVGDTAQVNFYFSSDRSIDTSDTYLGSTTVALNAGAHPKAAVNFTLPMNFPTGTYYFGYIVDPANAIAEADELNNAVAMGYTTTVPSYTPPTACFTMTPHTGPAPLRIYFNATCSSDADGYVTSYAWDFGDGATGTGATPSHQYNSTGTYMISLTVTDNQGHTEEMVSSVLVYGASGCLICEE